MTPEHRAAAKARCEAATPGPWVPMQKWGSEPGKAGLVDLPEWSVEREPAVTGPDLLGFDIASARRAPQNYLCRLPEEPGEVMSVDEGEVGLRQTDAAFIAHARADLPAALAEIDRLEAELAELRRRSKHPE